MRVCPSAALNGVASAEDPRPSTPRLIPSVIRLDAAITAMDIITVAASLARRRRRRRVASRDVASSGASTPIVVSFDSNRNSTRVDAEDGSRATARDESSLLTRARRVASSRARARRPRVDVCRARATRRAPRRRRGDGVVHKPKTPRRRLSRLGFG